MWHDILKQLSNKKSSQFNSEQKKSKGIKKIEQRFYFYNDEKKFYLTVRESEIVYHLLLGKNLSDIAVEMNLSSRTIEFYIKNIKKKLHCRTRCELIEKLIAYRFMKECGAEDG